MYAFLSDHLLAIDDYKKLIVQSKTLRKMEYGNRSHFSAKQLLGIAVLARDQIVKSSECETPLELVIRLSHIDLLRKIAENESEMLIAQAQNCLSKCGPQCAIFAYHVIAKLSKVFDSSTLAARIQEFRQDGLGAYLLFFVSKYCQPQLLVHSAVFRRLAVDVVLANASQPGNATTINVAHVAAKALGGVVRLLRDDQKDVAARAMEKIYRTAKGRRSAPPTYGEFALYCVVLENGFCDRIEDMDDLVQRLKTMSDGGVGEVHVRNMALKCLILIGPPLVTATFCLETFMTGGQQEGKMSKDWAKNYNLMLHTYEEKHQLEEGFYRTSVLQGMERNGHYMECYDLLAMLFRKIPNVFEYQTIMNPLISSLKKKCPTGMVAFLHDVPEIRPALNVILAYEFRGNLTIDDIKILCVSEPFQSMDIVERLFRLFESDDVSIRENLTLAIFNQAQGFVEDNKEAAAEVVRNLLRVCVTELSSSVRYSIVNGIVETKNYYPFLTPRVALEHLHVLVNDENFPVRRETVLILSRIQHLAPFDTLPILRHSILDNLALFSSKGAIQEKVEQVQLLEVMIPNVLDIMPIYLPVLYRVILEVFENKMFEVTTKFDAKAYGTLSTCLVGIIGEIAKSDISLIGDMLPRFIELLFTVVREHRKDLRLVAMTALTALVSQAGDRCPDRYALFKRFMGLGLKWNSKKLTSEFLRFLGAVGGVALDGPRSDGRCDNRIGKIEMQRSCLYVRIVCNTMISVLTDDSMRAAHNDACQRLTAIYCMGHASSSGTFHRFMTVLIGFIKKDPNAYLLMLINICQAAPVNWITPFCNEIVDLIQELWKGPTLMQVLDLIPALATTLSDRLATIISNIVLMLLECLLEHRSNPMSQSVTYCSKVLVALLSVKRLSGDFAFLTVTEVVKASCYPQTCSTTRISCLRALRVLIQKCNCQSFSATIVRCILYCLSLNERPIHPYVMQVVYSLQVALGIEFAVFGDVVRTALNGGPDIDTEQFLEIFKAKQPLTFAQFEFIVTEDHSVLPRPKWECDEFMVMTPVDITYTGKENIWKRKGWFKRIRSLIIRSSPCSCIAEAAKMATEVPFVAEQLFNVAFLSCWDRMNDQDRQNTRNALEVAMSSGSLPEIVLSALVSLIGFMEVAEAPLLINRKVLCFSSGNNANAFFFAVQWFNDIVSPVIAGGLSSIGGPESKEAKQIVDCSNSIIRIASHLGLSNTVAGLVERLSRVMVMPPECLEELGDWKSAIDAYASKADKARCLRKMMRWDDIVGFPEEKEFAAPLVVALYHKRRYTDVVRVFRLCDDDPNTAVFAAVAELKIGNTDMARKYIESAFAELTSRGMTRLQRDKPMLYPTLITAMQLTEISEVMDGKVCKSVWNERLRLCRKDLETYRSVIEVRYPFLDSEEQKAHAILLLKMALKNRNWSLFDAARSEYFQGDYPADVALLIGKALHGQGQTEAAVDEIRKIDATLLEPKLASRIFLCRGMWMGNLDKDHGLREVREAITYDRDFHRAWHCAAWIAMDISCDDPENAREMAMYSISALIESVRLKDKSSLADSMKMIELIFRTDLTQTELDDVSRNMDRLPDSFFLRVVNQFMAELVTGSDAVKDFVQKRITKLMPRHYHVLLFPLLMIDADIARAILAEFGGRFPKPLTEAQCIRESLLAMTTSCMERWRDVLTSLTYVEDGATAVSEAKREMADQQWTIDHASDLDAIIAKESGFPSIINELLACLRSEIETVRFIPVGELKNMQNCDLAVPGTYGIDRTLVKIERFASRCEVIDGICRSRLVTIVGSDGITYKSILKVGDDSCREAWVMQFFDLVNTCIRDGLPVDFRNLRLRRFAITPISSTCALVESVSGVDTLFELITSYRTRRHLTTYSERNCFNDLCDGSADFLLPIHRLELMREVDEATDDRDLERAMTSDSLCANHWINRMNSLAESSGVNSMIGHILGISDRYPTNILIDRRLGELVHVNFSHSLNPDSMSLCRSSAVPFRLTRMMRRAFGPSDIDGSFRIVSNLIMNLMRTHRRSIQAVLEMFAMSSTSSGSRKSVSTVLERMEGSPGSNLSVSDHVTHLISEATDMYNLSHMMSSWYPLW